MLLSKEMSHFASKNIDIILKKEESGTALTSKEVRNKRIYDTNSNAVSAYLQLIDQLIAKEATCDILIPLYTKNFEENKNNPLWIRRAAGRLDGKDCSDDPLFVTLVEQLHSLEPSADSAYYLGILNDKQGNSEDALKYIKNQFHYRLIIIRRLTYCIRLQLNLKMLEEEYLLVIMLSRLYHINHP